MEPVPTEPIEPRTGWLRRLPGAAAGLFLLVAALRLGGLLERVPWTGAKDLLPLALGAQALIQRLDPYDPEVLRGLVEALPVRLGQVGFLNYYPPSALLLALPLALLPFPDLVPVLRPLFLTALAGGAFLAALAALPGPSARRMPLALGAATLVLLLRVSLVVLRTGQVSPLVVLACGLGLWALARGRDRLAGAAIGLGLALKLFPGLLLFAALCGRRWRAAGTALAVSALLWPLSLCLLPEGSAGWDARAALGFLAHPPPPDWALDHHRALALLVRARLGLALAAALPACAWVAWRRPSASAPLGALLLGCGGLVVAGGAHYHESLLLLPAFCWALCHPWREGGPWPERAWSLLLLALLPALGVLGSEGPRSSPHWLVLGAALLPLFLGAVARAPR